MLIGIPLFILNDGSTYCRKPGLEIELQMYSIKYSPNQILPTGVLENLITLRSCYLKASILHMRDFPMLGLHEGCRRRSSGMSWALLAFICTPGHYYLSQGFSDPALKGWRKAAQWWIQFNSVFITMRIVTKQLHTRSKLLWQPYKSTHLSINTIHACLSLSLLSKPVKKNIPETTRGRNLERNQTQKGTW